MGVRSRTRLVGILAATGLPLLATLTAAPAYSLGSDCARACVAAPARGPKQPGPGKPGDPKPKPAKPKPPPDKEPPPVPSLGAPTVNPKGRLEISVVAEKGAKLVLTDDETGLVARTKATGASQDLKWRTTDGSHSYSLTATDKARNTSAPATFTVDVDATPPAVRRFVVKAGTAKDSRSKVSFATEPEADFRLLVDGRPVKQGVADGKPVEQVLDLPDGRHQVKVDVRDTIGNRAVATKPLDVRIPRLDVEAKLVSEVTEAEQVVKVRTTPNARGVLRVPGQDDRPFRLTDGAGEVTFELPDGTYERATVTVRDTQGRTGSEQLPDITVDTTAPVLTVEADRKAGSEGRLAADITAEKNSVVSWRLLDTDDEVAANGKYVAQGGAQTIERDVAEGDYRLEVTATDVYGRTTDKTTSAPVAADPWPVALIVLLILGALALLGLLAALLLRRRRRRRADRPEEEVAPKSRRARAKAAANSMDRFVAYQAADERWQQRNEALTRLLRVARGELDEEVPVPADLSLLPDERVLYSTPARLTEMVDSNRVEVALDVDQGELAVTTMRFAFVGPSQHRDWWCALVERVRHVEHERSLIKLWDSESSAGVTYSDPEVTRLYLDLAMSAQNGTREAFLAGIAQGLRDHEMRRPTPPTPAEPQVYQSR